MNLVTKMMKRWIGKHLMQGRLLRMDLAWRSVSEFLCRVEKILKELVHMPSTSIEWPGSFCLNSAYSGIVLLEVDQAVLCSREAGN